MTIRIGINGFGRMGRLALRAAWMWPDFEFVHINETTGGPEAAAHLLTFDSVHGRWNRPVTHEAQAIIIDGKRLTFSDKSAPGDVPWEDLAFKSTYEGIRDYFAGRRYPLKADG